MDEYTVELNTMFDLTLDENPTTGYAWTIQTTDGLKQVSERFIPSVGARSGLVGAGGHVIYTFQARRLGIQEIYGEYRQPWDPSTATYQDFRINVVPSTQQ